MSKSAPSVGSSVTGWSRHKHKRYFDVKLAVVTKNANRTNIEAMVNQQLKPTCVGFCEVGMSFNGSQVHYIASLARFNNHFLRYMLGTT
jgi:hypothetical protein